MATRETTRITSTPARRALRECFEEGSMPEKPERIFLIAANARLHSQVRKPFLVGAVANRSWASGANPACRCRQRETPSQGNRPLVGKWQETVRVPCRSGVRAGKNLPLPSANAICGQDSRRRPRRIWRRLAWHPTAGRSLAEEGVFRALHLKHITPDTLAEMG